MIQVDNLRKEFRVYKHHRGGWGAVRNLVTRDFQVVRAVTGVSFEVAAGELVGYLGPNGAGKSTTIKMLTGILVPTSGLVVVNNRVPWQERREHAAHIGVVFGQRTALWWDLPVIESLDLLRHIYRVPADRYRRNVKQITELLDMGPFLNTPVRSLSLGQRMRVDLAAALLHEPPLLFLDEPTIGLDVVAKERIRQFIKSINRERGTTVVLTTHDLGDVEKLCERVIMINQGRLMFDGALAELRARYGRGRVVIADFDGHPGEVSVPGARLLRVEENRTWLSVEQANGQEGAGDEGSGSMAAVMAALFRDYRVRDVSIEEPEIEEIVRKMYESYQGH